MKHLHWQVLEQYFFQAKSQLALTNIGNTAVQSWKQCLQFAIVVN